MTTKTKKYSIFKFKYYLVTSLFIISFTGFSQEGDIDDLKPSNWNLGASLQSRYIWRGINLGGNSASIQPSISYTKGIFSIGAWGAYSLGSDQLGQEADLYITISPLDFLSFTVTDYFFPSDRVGNQGYFSYGDKTGHVFESMVSFSGFKKFPINIFLATNFAGADKTENEDQSFSTYVEASYPILAGFVDLRVFTGAVFGDNGSYYGTDGSGLINLGIGVSKSIEITEKFNLPVDAALIFNPDAENLFITFGITI